VRTAGNEKNDGFVRWIDSIHSFIPSAIRTRRAASRKMCKGAAYVFHIHTGIDFARMSTEFESSTVQDGKSFEADIIVQFYYRLFGYRNSIG
jgi:hypothetical protein